MYRSANRAPLLLLLLALLLAACAQGASAPGQQEPAATGAALATEAPAAERPSSTQTPLPTPPSELTEAPAATEAPASAVESSPQPTTTQPGVPAAPATPSVDSSAGEATPISTGVIPEGEVAPLPTQPSGSPPATLVPQKPSETAAAHIVQVEWPTELRLGESDTVRLTLIPSSQGFTLITEYPEHETVTQTLTIERPSGFELFAVARLDGPGFDISPSGEQSQFLPENTPVAWRWSLTPRQSGRQRLALALGLRWAPLPGSPALAREVTVYSKSLDVQVHSFLGLTRSQAMRTGLLSLLLGGGISAFALVLRPHRRSSLRSVEPNPDLSIELPAGLRLDPSVRTLLGSLFSRYARLVVEHEFLSGYSGARTLLVLPIRPDGRADAYTIAKIGERGAVQREFENYETYVKDTLPPVTARIQHAPVTVNAPAGRRLAALQYTFIGRPGQPPLSLRQELLRKPDPDWLRRLMDTFGPNWWLQRRPYTFRLGLEYDRLLPTHLVVEPADGHGAMLDGRLPPSRLSFQPGDLVQMRHFATAEPRADGQSYSLQGPPSPGHPPLRVRWLSATRPDGATGRVVDTRLTLLHGWTADFDLFGLPDPLDAVPALIEETVAGGRSTIHGDLNLENILVGPGGMLWLIDFAGTRDGHTLMDFSHLAAELVAHILAPQIASPAEYYALLADPASSPNAGLYALVQTTGEMAARCLFNLADPSEYARSLTLACLGTLKYANLDAHARHLLYLTAAHTLRSMSSQPTVDRAAI